ncbi:MAG: hypothetical protein Kow00114_23820 [Kiloniellaceae bacterium]
MPDSTMFSAFVHRRPWFAALVGLLLGPFVGMLYLGKGARALAYLALGLSVYGLPPVLAHLGLLPVKAETVILVLLIAYRLGGALDCHRIAWLRDGAVPAVWFARWYLVAALGIVLPLAVRGLIWEPYNSPSASMEPSLRLGDYFIVTKLPYILDQPQRGDLVVFISSQDQTPYVKRLIGLPGDRVQMIAGSLYLNGERLPREEADMFLDDFVPGRGEIHAEFLPSGRSYLIREVSDQARYDDTDVYAVPPGQYFFLGDNRDNSLDSRMDMGFVPHENFIGRVSVILWNSEAQKVRFVFPE